MADPFISVADLGDQLGQDLSEDDAALAAVDAACDIVRTVTEQTFNLVEDDLVVLDGTGTDALVLPELPVVEVDGVTQNGEEIEDYVVSEKGVLLRPKKRWQRGRQNVAVTYTHGYDPEDLPRDIRMVALMIASRLFQQGIVRSETLGSYQVHYGTSQPTDLSIGEQLLLRKYRVT